MRLLLLTGLLAAVALYWFTPLAWPYAWSWQRDGVETRLRSDLAPVLGRICRLRAERTFDGVRLDPTSLDVRWYADSDARAYRPLITAALATAKGRARCLIEPGAERYALLTEGTPTAGDPALAALDLDPPLEP